MSMKLATQAEAYALNAKRKKDRALLREIMTDKGLTDLKYFFAFMDIMKNRDEATFADAYEKLTADESARFLIHFFECLLYWWDIEED